MISQKTQGAGATSALRSGITLRSKAAKRTRMGDLTTENTEYTEVFNRRQPSQGGETDFISLFSPLPPVRSVSALAGAGARGQFDHAGDFRPEVGGLVGFLHRYMEQRQAGAGEGRVHEDVTLPAVLLLVRGVVELDAGQRCQVALPHQQEVHV